jgi:hypothetical protein
MEQIMCIMVSDNSLQLIAMVAVDRPEGLIPASNFMVGELSLHSVQVKDSCLHIPKNRELIPCHNGYNSVIIVS